MTLTKWHFAFLVLAASAFCSSSNLFAQNEAGPRKPKVITFSDAENVKELYVAVMGEVNKPGTFHLDAASLNLHTVIGRAIGFTPEASRVIRVVRQGRISQKEIFSESINSSVFPGDLLIVDPRPGNMFSSRIQEFTNESTTIHASYQERAKPPVVQVGLMNVHDYPIVLRLRPEDASARRIVEGLRQPIQLLADADVITPGRRVTSDVAKQLPQLADGSVIVFKKASIDRSRLPATLPKPFESEIATGAQPGLIGNPLGQSPELRSLGERLMSFGQSPYESSSRTPNPSSLDYPGISSTPSHDPADEPASELPQPPGGNFTKPRIATVPFTGAPRIKTSSTAQARIEDVKPNSIPMPDDTTVESSTETLENGEPLSAEESSDAAPPAFSARQIVVVFLIVGALIGAAVFVRRIIETSSHSKFTMPEFKAPEPIAQSPAPMAAEALIAKPLLERLIKNELPIRLEEVEFPQGLLLQGRIAPRPVLRVDGAQSILKQQGPHFPAIDPTQGSSQNVIAQLDQPESIAIRRPHFMETEKRKVAAQIESTRATVESDAGADNAPLAKALFDLEQGGRS